MRAYLRCGRRWASDVAGIKSLYEPTADTNAEQSKLAAIEAGATGDQTAEEIQNLAWNGTVLGGTQTGITVTYDDTNGEVDFVTDVQLADTPANNQVAVFTGPNAIAGTAGYQWTGDLLDLYINNAGADSCASTTTGLGEPDSVCDAAATTKRHRPPWKTATTSSSG